MHRRNKGAAILAATVFASLPLVTLGQTSGSWVFNGSGDWSNPANWSPAVPDGGGIATFATHPLQTGGRTITLDMPVTLNGAVLDSVFAWTVSGPQVMTLTGPATLNVPVVSGSTPTSFPVGSGINVNIAGSSGLNKTGPGNISLGGSNTYTGGTTVTGGVIRTSVGDAAFGDLGGGIMLDGGGIRVSTVNMTSARNIVLGAGGGTFEMFFSGTFSGVISGPGSLNKTISGTLGFQGANTYTGATNFVHEGTLRQNYSAGSVFFQQGGSALNTSAINSSSTITLDNVAVNVNGRLNPSAPFRLNGTGLLVTGNASEPTEERLGAVMVDGGQSFFTVTPNAAQGNELTLASWTRQNGGRTVFRGVGLGNTPGANVATIFMTTPPTLVGGGGAAGSTQISIIPGATGGLTATATGVDLVTYGPNGVRPLSNAAGEYAPLAGAGPTDNVRTAATTATTGDQTVNALVIGSGALTGSDTITVASGRMINATLATHTANFNFGAAEGWLHTTSSGTFNGAFSGSGGLTKSGTGLGTFSNNNTYSGPTHIVAGEFRIRGDVPLNAPSAFGSSSDPIILAPGSVLARVAAITDVVIDRNLMVRGSGTGTASLGTTGSTQLITMNGNVTLERQLEGRAGPNNPITYSGTIAGPGILTDALATMSIITGNNTGWSGGIEVNTGSYYAGHDNAFGTGPIYLTGIGTIGATGGPRTVSNPITMFTPTTFNVGSSPLAGAPQDITFTGSFDLGSAGRTIQVPAGVTATFAGVMDHGGVTKTGPGSMRLTGANQYTGGTTVNEGMLVVDNAAGSGTGPNFVAINSATLAGNGTMAGPVTVAGNGVLSPGTAGPGTLTGGAVSLNDATGLVWDLDMPNVIGAGTNDLVVVIGDLVLDGMLTVNAGPSFGEGFYTLFSYSGVLTDNGVAVGALPSPYAGSIDTSVAGEVRLAVIPEPGAVGVLGLTAAAGLLRRRRVLPSR
jgi:fibronectin-binding autotransporter adhesin